MRGRVLVTGAGGFIGHHLTSFLKEQGYWVRGVDIKHPEYEPPWPMNLRSWICGAGTIACRPRGVNEVYGLAADMGGMGFISAHHAQILHNNA